MIDDNVAVSIISSVGGIVGIVLGGGGLQRYVKHRKRRRLQDVDDEEREAVQKYTADPGQFVKDILESNRQYANQVKEYAKEVSGLRAELQVLRDTDRKFRNALARWFVDIVAAFESNKIDMPYPRDSDAAILSDVIPTSLEATQPRRPRT